MEPIRKLEDRTVAHILARERWLMGECMAEVVALYVATREGEWHVFVPDREQRLWRLEPCDEARAREEYGDGDCHYPVVDVGRQYHLEGKYIVEVGQRMVGSRGELRIAFASGHLLTAHYNFDTDEASLYCSYRPP
ncbi:MAG: hypothetical protein D6786_10695 [Gammaproteobacteria bacterium]|nr:MAG: hypothetical protein D6786_10695 [Gammaproteobacteria bacterium]